MYCICIPVRKRRDRVSYGKHWNVDPVRRNKTERLKGTGAKAASLSAGMLLQKIAMDLIEGIENTDILFLEEDELLAVLQARMFREQTPPSLFPMNMENRANRRL